MVHPSERHQRSGVCDILLWFLLKLWSGSKPVSCCSSVWSGWRVSKLGCCMAATQPDLEKGIGPRRESGKINRWQQKIDSVKQTYIPQNSSIPVHLPIGSLTSDQCLYWQASVLCVSVIYLLTLSSDLFMMGPTQNLSWPITKPPRWY